MIICICYVICEFKYILHIYAINNVIIIVIYFFFSGSPHPKQPRMNAWQGQPFPVQAMPILLILTCCYSCFPCSMAENDCGDDAGEWLQELIAYNRGQAISLKRSCLIYACMIVPDNF